MSCSCRVFNTGRNPVRSTLFSHELLPGHGCHDLWPTILSPELHKVLSCACSVLPSHRWPYWLCCRSNSCTYPDGSVSCARTHLVLVPHVPHEQYFLCVKHTGALTHFTYPEGCCSVHESTLCRDRHLLSKQHWYTSLGDCTFLCTEALVLKGTYC